MGSSEASPPDAGWVVERPPPGPGRGSVAAPAWAVSLVGALVVLAGVGYLLYRLVRRKGG